MERGLALSYKTLSGFNFENQPFGALAARSRPRKEPGVACPTPGGEPDFAPSSETSERLRRAGRFVAWQLYGLLAGGSRERLSALFCRSRLFCYGDTTTHRTAARRDVPGSRLLGTFLGRDSHATN